jgi:hypothetical protein
MRETTRFIKAVSDRLTHGLSGDIFSSVIGGAIGAVATWFSVIFVSQPLLRFLEQREQVAKQLAFFANIAPAVQSENQDSNPPRDVLDAERIFRDLGTHMWAFATSNPVTVRLLKIWGMSPEQAAVGLVEFSNSIRHSGAEHAAYNQIEEALQLGA